MQVKSRQSVTAHPSESLSVHEIELARLKQEYQTFVYSVAHDLSAPFRQIEGFVDLIETKNKDTFDETTYRYFSFIKEGAQSGTDILLSLMEYARIQSCEMDVESIDLKEIITTCVDALKREHVMFTPVRVTMPSSSSMAVADKQLLRTAVKHLLHNAFMYHHDRKKARVSISFQHKPDYLQCEISDNGIGMDAYVLENADIALKRGVTYDKFPGKGMGVTSAKHIINRHGGTFHLSSIPDQGTTAVIRLPKKKPKS